MKPNNPAGELCSWMESAEPERVFDAEAIARINPSHEAQPPRYEPVFSFQFMTQWACEKLIEAAEDSGEWKRQEGDQYPGEECRFADISAKLDHHFRLAFCAIANTYLAEHYVKYRIAPHTMESPFLIRYRAGEGIQEMDVHNDGLSEVTFSIPLRNAHKGCGLKFALAPELGKKGGVGEALCFPGGPTHEHYVTPITEGERYSLTIWTRGV